MIKKILLILGTLLMLSSLTGCLKTINLSDRAIVQAIGIDYDEDKYKLSIQIFSPEGSGGQTAIDTSKQNSKVITTEGKTIGEAMSKADLKQGKKIFYGHNRLIILGESSAKKGLENVISFFNTDAQSKSDVGMLVVKGDANEILNAKITQGILPAETIEKIVRNAEDTGQSFQVRFYDVAKNYKSTTNSVSIPVIKLEDAEDNSGEKKEEESASSEKSEGDSKVISMDGISVFLDGRLKTYIDQENTRAIQILLQKFKSSVVVSESDSIGTSSVEIFKSQIKINPRIKNGDMSVDIIVKTDGIVKEIVVPEDREVPVFEYKDIEDSLEDVIKDEIDNVLYLTLKENNIDIFNFMDRIKQKYPSYWKDNRDDIGNIISNLGYNVKIDVNIDRTGLQIKDK
ncbi:MAG: Ger(x)C family spore germination protein [Oscillospiraceae bacterium]|nr:Ger(x)C family spore germination protein [Oscillospiraceae bacterium]